MKQVVVYSGRFQPFHKGHYATYKNILNKFKDADVYIGTSNKVEPTKSPFNFEEKKKIITTMFPEIPKDRVVQVKNPYSPKEILKNYGENIDIFITVVGEKDSERLGGKYFAKYSDDDNLKTFKDTGYVYLAPALPNAISGTDVRNWLSVDDDSEAIKNFQKTYPKFNEKIFKMIRNKLKSITEQNILLKVVFDSDMKKLVAMTSESTLENIFGYYNREFFGKLKVAIINEVIETPSGGFETNRHKQVNDFLKFACRYLKIKTPPKLELIDSDEYAKNSRALGTYDIYDQKISVCIKNRLGADILRTLAHELVHYKQHQMGHALDGTIGSKTENSANIIAAMLMRKFAEGHSEIFTEMSYQQMKSIDNKADQLMGFDVDLGKATDHFFIRLNDPRNEVEITPEELESFFERLSRKKEVFLKFLEKYKNELVVKDIKTKINIPFMKKANKIIAKTVMRKKTFNTKGEDFLLHEMIKKVGDKWVVYPKKGGDRLGTHDTKQGAIKQLQAIELNKEDIEIDVDPGDTVLMGKFKNKKVTVKDIGVDDHGMPTINGKKAVTFRIPDTENDDDIQTESIISEGGAYGHMAHPFDIDMNLTFGDLKQIVTDALNGELEFAREKTDGQALAISWKNGKLIAARNKGHLANAGENAMSKADLIAKFEGRGEIADAFKFAIEDLERAISALPENQKQLIFQEGKSFMNCEVIYPESANVIPYGQSLLVFHGTMEYDEKGNPISENPQAGKELATMIEKVNANVQNKFTIQGPPVQTLPKNEDLKNLQPIYISKINQLQNEFGLSDSDGVEDYHQAWWEQWIDKNSPVELTPEQRIGLVKRWAFSDKSYKLTNIKDPELKTWAEQIDKIDQQKISKQNIMKFEEIFLGVGAAVLSFMKSVLTVNPETAKQSMLDKLQNTIQTIKSSGDEKSLNKLELELKRLEKLGGFDKIVPAEGLVFSYKGNTYKLTGAFAPLNQILGIFKYSR